MRALASTRWAFARNRVAARAGPECRHAVQPTDSVDQDTLPPPRPVVCSGPRLSKAFACMDYDDDGRVGWHDFRCECGMAMRQGLQPGLAVSTAAGAGVASLTLPERMRAQARVVWLGAQTVFLMGGLAQKQHAHSATSPRSPAGRSWPPTSSRTGRRCQGLCSTRTGGEELERPVQEQPGQPTRAGPL